MKNNRIVIIGWADSVHVERWCEGLAGRGFNIKLVSVGGQPLPKIDTMILPRKNGLSYLLAIPQVKKEIQLFKPDLVHAHYIAGNGLIGLFSSVRPLVSSVWGSDIDSNSNSFLVNHVVNKVLNGSTHITVTSDYLKSKTLKRINKSSVPVYVIPFGVKIPAQTIDFPQPKPFKICYLKAHKPVYGLDILIEAMSIAATSNLDITLSVAGEPNAYTHSLKNKISDYGIEKNVNFAGLVPYESVYSFISNHHALVMPSRSEGFGVAAAEASACGRPVIATNVGGIPEIVINGETGILVPPNDPASLAQAILKLANDIQLCHKLRQAGYEYVKKNYDWENSLDQMCELYERVVNESRQTKN